jgi:superfamily II DNA or RNA helicase
MSNPIYPYLQDPQNIIQLASDRVYRMGLDDYKNNCVFECYAEHKQIVGSVEGDDSNLPYTVRISLADENGKIKGINCYCGHTDETACRHAVATLLQYAQQTQEQQEGERFLSVKESAIVDRIKRGRSEVQVEPIDNTGCFGHWRTESISSATHRQQAYTVQIRSLSERQNLCTCPDWANNQLGTCKHIEAVLYKIERDRDAATHEPSASKPHHLIIPFIYRGWQDHKVVIRLQRTAHMAPELQSLLAQYFDPKGDFVGQLPEDFFQLQNSLYANDAIQIGDDAIQAVQHLVTQQAHQLQKQHIVQQFELSAGRIGGINAKLFPYQIEGAAFLAANGRALLADDMGLGKTLQAIVAAYWLHKQAGVAKVLIICPASLKSQWAREIEKFTGMSSQVIQGNAAQRLPQYRRDSLFMIANYEIIQRDLEVINQELHPDLIILDEAQRIKNWRTKIASSIKLLHSRYAFVLSGTPLENRLEDLYSLMQVVDPLLLGPLWRYMADFHISDDKGKVLGYRNLTELRRLISPAMLRRNRSIVSDQLPARSNIQLDVSMSNRQRDLHDGAMNAAGQLADIAKKRPLTPNEQNRLMSALQQARMACDAAGLVDKETEGSPKLDELRQLLTEQCIENGHKVVVFSQWRGMTDMVAKLTDELNIGSVHLHGGVPTAKRGELIERFSQNDDVAVFISTDAGGTGLNLQSASVLINMDVPWNPAVLEQRNARIHRLGQNQKVQIILMVASNSYEEKVLALLNNKQTLFDNVVASDASEDVVGVTRKTLDTLVQELQNKDPIEAPANEVAEQTITDTTDPGETSQPMPDDEEQTRGAALVDVNDEDDQRIKQVISQLSFRFAGRIEQMLGKGGDLLVILDQLNNEDSAFIDSLDSPISVAAIDLANLRQLQKLGGLSPLNLLKELPLTATAQVRLNPWLKQAQDKLAAAKLLHQHAQTGSLDLLVAAVCAKLTSLAEKNHLLSAEDACVCLYTDHKLQQKLNAEQVASIGRLLSLRANAALPASLLLQLLNDVEVLLENDE